MSATYLSLHYHIIFSTKNRESFMVLPQRAQFHEYIVGTLRGLEVEVEQVGGTNDHIHLLVGLKATHRLSDLMRELKKATSTHAKSLWPKFSWQDGYAAFTVSASAREDVKQYIARQEEHHRVKNFREELEQILKKSGVEYDPQYLD